MAALQIIALDTTTPQLRAPASGDTYSAPRAIELTPETLTGSSATSALAITQTWNTTGTPTAFQLNLTDTASNANSLLMDLRVGGATQFRVAKGSRTTASTWEADVGYLSGYASVAAAMARTLTQRNLIMDCAGSAGTGVYLPSYAGYYFTASAGGTDVGVTSDLALRRDAANTLAQRNGVNAQAFRVYGTFTDSSNYQRLRLSTDTIFTENAGTGAAQSLSLGGTSTGARMVLNPDGAIQFYGASVANIWNFSTAGHLLAASDNTRDIGASGANRPRYLYLGGGLLTGSQADSSLVISPTWNTTGTPTAIDLNVTDTASNAASLLLNLRVGGVSKLSVSKDGSVRGSNNGMDFGVPYATRLRSDSGLVAAATGYGFGVQPSYGIGWASDTTFSSNVADLVLRRDAANTLAQRNGTNAQAFNIYNTFTDASNYERGSLGWSSNFFDINSNAAGTGTARSIRIRAGTSTWTFDTNGSTTLPANALTFAGGFTLGRASGVLTLSSENQLSGATFEMREQTAPAAPAADRVRIYAEDNGSGKTRLMALFATGAAQQIAIEP